MTSNISLTSPLPIKDTYVILHRQNKLLHPATIVPLDTQNSRLFADWDLEHWEMLRKLEWYRRPFVQDLLRRQSSGREKTFLLLTRLADFPRLLTECTGQSPSLSPKPLFTQIQAALTVQIAEHGPTVIYNIETAPWNKLGPQHRFFSIPAAALFFFAAQHHLSTAGGGNKFILSHPTDDGVIFYQEKLQLRLLWSRGQDRYAVVERASLLQALLSYKKNLEELKESLPLYEPE
ncbi:MAG: hypothetical protein JSU72_06000 [Deltaproteobacteria bacterium]|nr:MAG: hypothetical protein JSU72_06000 [Deltaproteobacteria bacterium]